MTSKTKQPQGMGPTRVRYADVTNNVKAYLEHPDTPEGMRKRLYTACGMTSSDFSHRMTAYRGERFKIEHFGAMAVEANAPEPWPFVDWKTAQAFQAFKRLFEAGTKER